MKTAQPAQPARRSILKKTLALSALSVTGVGTLGLPTLSFAASLSKEERDAMTPDAVIAHFKQGNLRFRENRPVKHDYLAQKRNSIAGQYPAAVILSCIDSRAPAEIVLDVTLKQLNGKQQAELAQTLHQWRVQPNGTEGYRTAEVTLGGVDTTLLSSKTMEARDVPGLYFIGEVVDVTGWLGGYNFQWAWSSAWACAQAL